MGNGKLIFFSVWVVLTTGLVLSIVIEPARDGSGKSIGRIEEVDGSIQVKPDAKILWRDVSENHKIRIMDSISTGPDGSAVLNLSNSQPLKLGPNSTLTIRTSKRDQSELIVDLEKGLLEVEKNENPNKEKQGTGAPLKSLTIKAGQQSFQLNSQNAELAILKDKTSPTKVLRSTGGIIQNLQGRDTTLTPVLEDQEAIESYKRKSSRKKRVDVQGLPTTGPTLELPEADPVELEEADIRVDQEREALALAKIEMARAKKEEEEEKKAAAERKKKTELKFRQATITKTQIPRLNLPNGSNIGWTWLPLNQLKQSRFRVQLVSPNELQRGFKWTPFVEGISPGHQAPSNKNTGPIEWEGKPTIRPQLVQINLADTSTIIQLGQAPFKNIKFQIRAGVSLEIPGVDEPDKSYGKNSNITIYSLHSPPKASMEVGFNLWSSQQSAKPIVWPKSSNGQSRIWLRNGDKLTRLKGLLQSSAFSINFVPRVPRGPGYMIVKNKAIIAKVSGRTGGESNIIRLTKLMGGDYAFKGMPESLIGGPKELERLTKAGKLPPKIYILNNGKTIAISPSFIKSNRSVQLFLNDHKSAFFSMPIRPLKTVSH